MVKSAIALVVLVPVLALAGAKEEGSKSESSPAEQVAQRLVIVDLLDETPFRELERGQLVRVVGRIPSGGEVTAEIVNGGPAKLEWEAKVLTVKNGKVLIGELVKEFVFRRRLIGQGPVKVEVRTTPPGGGTPTSNTYEFEWKR